VLESGENANTKPQCRNFEVDEGHPSIILWHKRVVFLEGISMNTWCNRQASSGQEVCIEHSQEENTSCGNQYGWLAAGSVC